LRATLDWSYDLLGTSERQLLARLAVFAGGWTLEATEAVCAGDEVAEHSVLDLLDGLVNKSLVQVEDGGDALRYWLLETIRAYARERLDARGEAEAAAIHGRHAAYYLALTEHAAPYINGPEEPMWLAWLDAERDNVRAALRWFVARGAAAEGLRLACALSWYWYKRDAQAEGAAWLTRALALPDPAPGVLRARALIEAGRNANAQGDPTAAQQLLEAALTLGQQLDDRDTMAQALLLLGPAALMQGNYRLARARLKESLALFRTLDDRRGIAEALCYLSRVLTHLGEQTLAQSCLEEALTLARGAGERRLLALALELRGELAFARGEDAEADRLWQESLALYSELSMGMGIVTVENFLGQLALRQGDHATARARYVASLEHQQGWPALQWTIDALAGLAVVAAARGQAGRTLRLAGASSALSEAAGLRLSEAERAVMERASVSARATLGDRQADAEWAAGQALTVDQAIAYALEPEAPG
jgi:non-specific serine/threonine protein kinase